MTPKFEDQIDPELRRLVDSSNLRTLEEDGAEMLAALEQLGPVPNPWLRPPNAREQQHLDDDAALAKNLGLSHRKVGLLDFLKRRMALGETVASVVAFAGQHDSETAMLLREVAEENGLS